MSMNSAHNRLKRAERDLLMHWERVRQLWQDEKAQQFFNERLDPLIKQARTAHDALVHLESVLTNIRRDCE